MHKEKHDTASRLNASLLPEVPSPGRWMRQAAVYTPSGRHLMNHACIETELHRSL